LFLKALVENYGNFPGRNTGIPEFLEIPAVTWKWKALRSRNFTSGQPNLRGGGDQKLKKNVSVFVDFCVHNSSGGWKGQTSSSRKENGPH
jgi:hypothetical protein